MTLTAGVTEVRHHGDLLFCRVHVTVAKQDSPLMGSYCGSGSEAAPGQHKLLQAVKEASRLPQRRRRQWQPNTSYLGWMYGVPPLDSRSRLPKRQRGAVRPTKPHPSCTKMSLTLVFAPVEVLEEMAAALPVSLHPLSYKIRQQTDFNVFFCVFFRQSRQSGQWDRIHLLRGCERAAGNREDVAGGGPP